MSLLTGFMMKEDRKPLRYMTNGIVAINFCWSKEEEQNEGMGAGVTPPPHPQVERRRSYLVKAQSVDEVHGHVRLGQVDDQPGGHVEKGHLQTTHSP